MSLEFPSFRVVLGVVLLSVLPLACGSETLEGTPAGTTPSIPDGTCSLTLVDGATKTSWSGTPRVSMNGSGNLRVECIPKSGDDRVVLAFGNGTFDGPRRYLSDEASSDGDVRYENPDRGDYRSHTKGGNCTLVLTEAKLDALGSSVPVGERVAGTFACQSIVAQKSGAMPPTYAVESGEVAGIVER